MKKNDENWDVLDYFENLVEANIVKGVLETNGVPCVITSEVISSVLPLSLTTVAPIKVLVPKDKLEFAREILASPAIGESDDETKNDA